MMIRPIYWQRGLVSLKSHPSWILTVQHHRCFSVENLDEQPPSHIPDPFGRNGNLNQKDKYEKLAEILADYPILTLLEMNRRHSIINLMLYKKMPWFQRLFKAPGRRLGTALAAVGVANRACKDSQYFPEKFLQGVNAVLKPAVESLSGWNGAFNSSVQEDQDVSKQVDMKPTQFDALQNMYQPYILNEFSRLHHQLDDIGLEIDFKLTVTNPERSIVQDVSVTFLNGQDKLVASTLTPGMDWRVFDGFKSERRTRHGLIIQRQLWQENVVSADDPDYVENGGIEDLFMGNSKENVVIGVDCAVPVDLEVTIRDVKDRDNVLERIQSSRVMDVRLDSNPVNLMEQKPQDLSWKIADIDRCLIQDQWQSFKDALENNESN